MTVKRLGTGMLGVLMLVATVAERAMAACPSCKEGLATADRWAQGFNTSILFMLVMPFAVVAVIAGAVYRASRRPDPPGEHEIVEQTPPDPG